MELSNLEMLTEKFHLRKVELRGDEIFCLCPFHDDTHIGSFSINSTTGEYFCFACLAGGNIVNYGYQVGLGLRQSVELWATVKDTRSAARILKPKTITNVEAQSYINHGLSKYALGRMSERTLLDYHVYSDGMDNPVFLIRDKVAWRAIWIRDEGIESRYSLLKPLTAKRDGYLFGGHLPSTDYTVVTEGFFDAMAFWEKLGQRGVCLNGVWATDGQVRTLEQMQPLVLFLDGDKRGREAMKRIYHRIRHLDFRVSYRHKGDADEHTAAELQHYLDTAVDKIQYRMECL